MTGNVSFYLIAILAQRVKIHSLQERNVLIVDRHVKKNVYITIIHLKWRCLVLKIYRAAKLRFKYPPLAIDTEVNNCFSKY